MAWIRVFSASQRELSKALPGDLLTQHGSAHLPAPAGHRLEVARLSAVARVSRLIHTQRGFPLAVLFTWDAREDSADTRPEGKAVEKA